MANNPSALLSAGNALARVRYLALGKTLHEGRVPAGKRPAENSGDDQQRQFRLDTRISGKSNPFNIKESEEEVAGGKALSVLEILTICINIFHE